MALDGFLQGVNTICQIAASSSGTRYNLESCMDTAFVRCMKRLQVG